MSECVDKARTMAVHRFPEVICILKGGHLNPYLRPHHASKSLSVYGARMSLENVEAASKVTLPFSCIFFNIRILPRVSIFPQPPCLD